MRPVLCITLLVSTMSLSVHEYCGVVENYFFIVLTCLIKKLFFLIPLPLPYFQCSHEEEHRHYTDKCQIWFFFNLSTVGTGKLDGVLQFIKTTYPRPVSHCSIVSIHFREKGVQFVWSLIDHYLLFFEHEGYKMQDILSFTWRSTVFLKTWLATSFLECSRYRHITTLEKLIFLMVYPLITSGPHALLKS